MGKFDLFNKFYSAVIVIDEKSEVVFRNNVFKRVFPDFETLEKFSHKLNYNVCALVSNDVEVHSPIKQAMNSEQDFSAHVLYQSSGNDYFYYDMAATKKGKFLIIVFTDVTAKVGLEYMQPIFFCNIKYFGVSKIGKKKKRSARFYGGTFRYEFSRSESL